MFSERVYLHFFIWGQKLAIFSYNIHKQKFIYMLATSPHYWKHGITITIHAENKQKHSKQFWNSIS